MEKEQIIELLKHDMMGEHQAIIQYLNHAYAMEEGEIPCEIEGIARDEMRHLDWLADVVVELGGDPSMERLAMDSTERPPAEQMRKDIGLEQSAIADYRAHIKAIDDPEIQVLLGRIVQDELRHEDIFRKLVKEAEEEGEGTAEPDEAEPRKENEEAATSKAPKRLAEILNLGIRHEYTVILQYLYHSFMAEDKELFEDLQMTAINEMQHMGWLSEELAGRGGKPDMSHSELVLTHDMEKALQADIVAERAVIQDYTNQAQEIEDERLRILVQRIRDHEIYHDGVFNRLLDKLREEREPEPDPNPDEETKRPPTTPSVGSLIDRD